MEFVKHEEKFYFFSRIPLESQNGKQNSDKHVYEVHLVILILKSVIITWIKQNFSTAFLLL